MTDDDDGAFALSISILSSTAALSTESLSNFLSFLFSSGPVGSESW